MLSKCMLFTVSQFLIPLSLQIYYDIYPMYLSLTGVFFMGIFYHNHLLKTKNNPYRPYKIFDMTLVLIASLLVLMYGKTSKKILIISTTVPIFYIISKIINNSYIHSILHISAISASTLLVFHLKNKGVDVIDAIIITGSSYVGYICYNRSLEYFENNSLQDKKIKLF